MISAETFAILLIVLGLVLGLIGRLLPEGPTHADTIKPKDPKAITAQANWEGLQPK